MSHTDTGHEQDGEPAPGDGLRRDACPLCASNRLQFALEHKGYRVERCIDCGFQLINPQPSDEELAAIYSSTYFLGDGTAETAAKIAEMKQATARSYLEVISQYRSGSGGELLEIGCGHGDFLIEAGRMGYSLTGVELAPDAARTAQERVPGAVVHCGLLEDAALPAGKFDVCVLCDVIEHDRDPVRLVRTIQSLLKPDGVLFLATPSLDSWSAKLLRSSWMEYKPEHLSYFNANGTHNLLCNAGYREVLIRPGWKVLTLEYVAHHFKRFPIPLLSPLVGMGIRLVPRKLRERRIPVVASGMMVCARAGKPAKRQKLSVIVPAYNEAGTFDALMQGLLKKQLAGMDIEVVVVESNSTDGTRDLARQFARHPRVKLVLEEQPRGKGHAVRTGLAHATGDFILIQDADLEYDLDDYEALLEPLRRGRTSFVLGARHGGKAFKMRRFNKQRFLSSFLNVGHWLFTTLVNVLFGLRLYDPFTMFKVFRRDCLAGLTFECNRFDFDYEILIKLVRKGYRPLEIPVNYRSRSFKEGKKVSMFRDPLTWIWALARLRLCRIDPLSEIARQRSQAQPSPFLADNKPSASRAA
jgi:2-polyprenyl-3-methyl-5-hydroxy-6-metoxy-1,4-benzoquinol methylase